MSEYVMTAEEIEKCYNGCLASVDAIQKVLDGDSSVSHLPADDQRGIVERNVSHLKTKKAHDYWTDEDFTNIDAAITAGEAWLV